MISARERSFKECSATAGNGLSVNGRSVNRPRRQIPSRSSSPPGAPSRRSHGSLRSAPSPQPALAAPGGHQRPGHATPTRGGGARKGRGRFQIRTLAVAVFPLPRASAVMPPPAPFSLPPSPGPPSGCGGGMSVGACDRKHRPPRAAAALAGAETSARRSSRGLGRARRYPPSAAAARSSGARPEVAVGSRAAYSYRLRYSGHCEWARWVAPRR